MTLAEAVRRLLGRHARPQFVPPADAVELAMMSKDIQCRVEALEARARAAEIARARRCRAAQRDVTGQ